MTGPATVVERLPEVDTVRAELVIATGAGEETRRLRRTGKRRRTQAEGGGAAEEALERL